MQAFTAAADFLSFLFGRADSAAASVRSGSTSLDAAVADVLSTALQRADGLKQSLAALPDAKAAQAVAQEIDAAVAAMRRRLEVGRCGKGLPQQQCCMHAWLCCINSQDSYIASTQPQSKPQPVVQENNTST